MNILITGITGFFGRNFVLYLLKNNIKCNIVGTSHSELKLAHFRKIYPNIQIYIVDLSSEQFSYIIESIIQNHKIDYIIHAAAMKHVDICQNNPSMCLYTNIVASNILVNIAKRNNVINLIALSTDKTNNPSNVYGASKYIMQEIVLVNNYSVYQGVNFFWSDGSVLDIWFNQYQKNLSITIRNQNYIRYFNTIEYVCDLIFRNINKKGIIYPEEVYMIKLKDLLDGFVEYFDYHQINIVEHNNYEKMIEQTREDINKIELKKDDIIKLITDFHKNNLYP